MMVYMDENIHEKLGREIERIANELIASKVGEHYLVADSVELVADSVERSSNKIFGDYTSNVALLIAGRLRMSPQDVAALMREKFSLPEIEKIEVAGPGHLNFFLSQEFFSRTVEDILEQKKQYGSSSIGIGEKVNNEFISANPTGPLHLGNARGGFYGDVLSNVLRKMGYEVTNEYYVNDAGEQIIKLAHSVLKDNEAVYKGDYIDQIANELAGEIKQRIEIVRPYKDSDALEYVINFLFPIGRAVTDKILRNYIEPTVKEKMRVHFDSWVRESWFYNSSNHKYKGQISRAIKILIEKGLTYKTDDGALWLKTTDFGDDKDRVLVKRKDLYKNKTYFAADCGYLLYKIENNFDLLIETWGADHHGYINRFRAAAEMLGFNPEKIRFNIVQLVRLVKDGQEVRMSKRAGNVVTIDELIEKVGHDVARFFFLMYAPETHMNFDLGLAEERSQKNPVFYVQYAHARLCSILRKAEEEKISFTQSDLALLTHEKERELMRELSFFPELVATIALEYTVHKLPQYAIRLSDKFHSFYAACKVIDAGNPALTAARLELIGATRIVLAETLMLMGIAAPEKM